MTYHMGWGMHTPVCWNRCLKIPFNSRDNLSWITFLMILTPMIVWESIVRQHVQDNLSQYAIPIAVSALVFLSLLFFFISMFTEPGILPSITIQEIMKDGSTKHYSFVTLPTDMMSSEQSQSDHNNDDNNNGFPSSSSTETTAGAELATTESEGMNINSTASLLEELFDQQEFIIYDLIHFRAKFSRYTYNCIENFDHYCPWIGNAVGRRNYRPFVFFLLSAYSLAATVFGSTLALIINESKKHHSFKHTMRKEIAATIIGIYSFFIVTSLTGLVLFNLNAIAKNQTTNEIIKQVYKGRVNPYNKGVVRNIIKFLCEPTPPSRVAKMRSSSPESTSRLNQSILRLHQQQQMQRQQQDQQRGNQNVTNELRAPLLDNQQQQQQQHEVNSSNFV